MSLNEEAEGEKAAGPELSALEGPPVSGPLRAAGGAGAAPGGPRCSHSPFCPPLRILSLSVSLWGAFGSKAARSRLHVKAFLQRPLSLNPEPNPRAVS